ncbi:hypothetical protein QO010_004601 [Caulobacter ginsengisoli]|uniref:Phospholipase n=1 Tax=Caulobacter ginsengisoli TaxID=400775 RepID=A0ABU0IXT3_9CAUL|nr:hypothetical protein [Caulobacter ginsengisoli]MDQ0466805.1 hypothetical protein [Caulobacter ginsengisoli]
MRGLAIAGLSAAILIGLTGSAQGFGTLRSLGQNAEHERITRDALGGLLQPWTLAEMAGENGQYGAVGSPDDVSRGLMFRHENHCDGGDYYAVKDYPQSRADAQRTIEDCRRYIFARLDEAVKDAGALVQNYNGIWMVRADQMTSKPNDCSYRGTKGRAKCNVLEDMGLALHAAQDFYSHSNWVDRTSGDITVKNPPGLGNAGRARWLDPRYRGEGFPGGLITGCFTAKPEMAFCNYGLLSRYNRVKHDYLNKDGADAERGKNGNFDRAWAAAVEDSRDKWNWLEERIRATYAPAAADKIICALRNDSPGSCADGRV